MSPIVERLSNAGAFGPGNFTDHSNADVGPALVVAALLAGIFAAAAIRQQVSHAWRLPEWIRQCAAQLDDRRIWRLAPLIFGLQTGALFSMETLEQLAVWHHVLGGWIWLGAPPLVGLALHFAGGVAITLVIARLLRFVAPHVAATVGFAIGLMRDRGAGSPTRWHVIRADVAFVYGSFSRAVHGRAPPQPSV